MVDSTGPLSSLLRAQATAPLVAKQSASQTIVELPQKTAVAPAKVSAVTQPVRLAGISSAQILPRGSIVDVVA